MQSVCVRRRLTAQPPVPVRASLCVQPGSVHRAFWLRAAQMVVRHSCAPSQALAQAQESEALPSAGPSSALADLLIVGPGVLGARLGQLWLLQHASATVTGQTNTSQQHDRYHPLGGPAACHVAACRARPLPALLLLSGLLLNLTPCRLRQLGLTPCTRSESCTSCANVVFSAPPSGSEDYVSEVRLPGNPACSPAAQACAVCSAVPALSGQPALASHTVPCAVARGGARAAKKGTPPAPATLAVAAACSFKGPLLAQVCSALQQWDGTGTFVFTSSVGVYPEDNGGTCREASPTASQGSSPRLDRCVPWSPAASH